MKRIIKITGLPVLGLLIVLAGFAYDVKFAGIPYQDPTPELQARYDFHSTIADMCYKTGGIILLGGLVVVPKILKKTKKMLTKTSQRTSR
jgi:hypothetical protein